METKGRCYQCDTKGSLSTVAGANELLCPECRVIARASWLETNGYRAASDIYKGQLVVVSTPIKSNWYIKKASDISI